MIGKKKTQTQKQHYAHHRELISLLFRFPKHKLFSLYLNGCENEKGIKLFFL